MPNIQKLSLFSDALGRDVRFKVAVASVRSVEIRGGLDNFLLKSEDDKLSTKARRVKKAVAKAIAKAAVETAAETAAA